MHKRGQVTLFVIIGIVVIVVIVLFLILSKKINKEETNEAVVSEGEEIYEFTQDCVEEVGEASLVLIAKQGGRYKDVENFINYNGKEVADYCVNIPSDLKIIDEINLYFQDNFIECLDYYSQFESAGYKIQHEDPFVSVGFYEDSTLLNVIFPIKAVKGNNQVIYNEFSHSSDFPFLKLYRTAVRQANSAKIISCGKGVDVVVQGGPTLCNSIGMSKICDVFEGGYEFDYAI
ncbi:MAG: hypothetical protein PHT54_05015 [Candidatus Nanoarchaeia archaeon]|nr:hypothetical protein [Candidatus Nanoarchaeia archaeon]